MKPIAIVLSALAVSVAVLAATHPTLPTKDVRFTASGDSVVVPFVLRNNQVLVRGRIGESDSLWFIVDSGAGAHCVNASTAKALGIEVRGGAEARGAGGTVKAGAASDLVYRVKDLEIEAPFSAAIDLDEVGRQIGVPVGGVLGYPLFERTVFTFDYDRSELVLHRPSFEPVGAALPITFHDNHPYIPGRLTLPGREPGEGSFVLDTGSALALVLSPGYVEKERALESVPKTMETRLGGVGGLSLQPVGRIERLELGPYALEHPIAVLSKPGPGTTSSAGSFGNIGGDVLQRFRVTFDYPRRELRIVAGQAYARAFEADMTGMILTIKPDGDAPVEVVKVNPGSPAAEAGVAAGDRVASVDGRPLAAGDLAGLRKRMKVEGEELHLGLVRGTERPEAVIVTRRMI